MGRSVAGKPEIPPLLTNPEMSIFSIYSQTIFMTCFQYIECIKKSRNDVVSVILSRPLFTLVMINKMAEAQAKRRRLLRDENDNLLTFEEFEGFKYTSSNDGDPEIDDIQWKNGCHAKPPMMEFDNTIDGCPSFNSLVICLPTEPTYLDYYNLYINYDIYDTIVEQTNF